MSKFFIPYSGRRPVFVNVNGHKVIMLSKDRSIIEEDLESVGADGVKVVNVKGDEREEEEFLVQLALKNSASIIYMDDEISPKELINNLKYELPWLQ